MKSWKKPTNELIDKALQSTKKVTARKYFFSRLENPLWLKPLVERGCFKYPPKAQRFNDGTVIYPYWPEIQYLKNVCRDAPDEIINLVMELPPVDNPIVYDGILDIALQLQGEKSAILKPKILEYAGMDHQIRTYKYIDLLAHWTKENQTFAALEFSEILVAFAPDPQSEEKHRQRKEDPMDLGITLHPSPRLNPSEYSRVMAKGVRPLAESEPYKVACLLIDATSNMLLLRTYQEDLDKEKDHSEIWCNLLSESDSDHEGPEKTLVHTLTFACEQVFGKSPDAVEILDKLLRKQQWKVFKRLRHHLYALHPNEQTIPWIRELILAHEDYSLWEHHYEFQQMIRSACEHFGETLLTKIERTHIFDAILEGPSEENYRHWVVGWLGDEFTEERFQERQERFHLSQFTPFAPVLFGKYATRYEELKDKAKKLISDEDYLSSKVTVGSVSNRSPRPPEDLANFTNEDLLAFINDWEKEDEFSEDNPFVRINIESLANAFQTVFRKSIIPDADKFKFWIDNRKRIERPIYVQAMIKAMQAQVKDKNFDQLDEWLTFSEWVLTHLDQEHEGDDKKSDESRENPDWSSARRAVCDFVGICLEKDVDVPFFAQRQLAKLLKVLCTQFDSRLDQHLNPVDPLIDPLTEGINSTRSIALENLVKFGFWLRSHDSKCKVTEITEILKNRFAQEAEYPLTFPEYAVLGRNYYYIFSLDKPWATRYKSDFFPRKTLPAWLAAFGSLIDYSDSFKPIFEVLQDDFNFALQHLADFKKHDRAEQETIDMLVQHLFTYYLWDMYPLRGDKSLLERYYQQTDANREHWANLFNDIGHRLWNSGKNLEQNMVDRVIEFFEWRFEQEEPMELRYFTIWLQAECLDAKWRLNAYSKVLDVCEVEDWGFHFKTLCEMLPNHTAKVVECFFKLTDGIKNDNVYIGTEEAKAILKAGFESNDENVCQIAVQARENLLRADRFDLLDLYDGEA